MIISSVTRTQYTDSYFSNFLKVTVTPLQSMRLVVKANSATFQQNRFIFSAAPSPVMLGVAGVEVSIVLHLENRNVTPYIQRLWAMTVLFFCSTSQAVYILGI